MTTSVSNHPHLAPLAADVLAIVRRFHWSGIAVAEQYRPTREDVPVPYALTEKGWDYARAR